MKILVVSQYFYPENFRINDLCIGLKEQGHKVSVLTAKPNYPNGIFFEGYSFLNKSMDKYNGIKIYRSPITVPCSITAAEVSGFIPPAINSAEINFKL